MEMLKKLKKRIVPLVLAVVIFATSVVSGPASLTAQASSVAVSTETSVEFVMMLYNIFETISIASGMKEGLDDYSKGMSIFEAFIQFIDGLTYDPFKEFTIYGPDGTAMTREEFDAIWESAVGAGKLKVKPNEGEFAKYRVLTGGLTPTPSPDPSASPSPSPIPGPGHGTDLNPNIPKRGIGAFAMGTDMQFQKAAADFLNRVQNNEVPEVEPAEYYGTAGLFIDYEKNSVGNIIVKGSLIGFNSSNYYAKQEYIVDYVRSDYIACVDTDRYFAFISGTNPDDYCSVPFKINYYRGSTIDSSYSQSIKSQTKNGYIYEYFLNIPIFDSDENARNYLLNGNTFGLLNGVPYDYHSMTAAAPDTLENLSGTKLDPAKVPRHEHCHEGSCQWRRSNRHGQGSE